MLEEYIVMELTKLVYDSKRLKDNIIRLNYQQEEVELICLDYINETNSFWNGLQAAAYLLKGSEYIYLIIRGADVGAGKSIFRFLGANQRFIPESIEENPWRTLFQDWIYTSVLGSMGLVHLYQYDSLKYFYGSLQKEFSKYHFIIGGHSLGGMLAQRLFLLESGIDRCVTYAGISPWWTLNAQSQRFIREHNFWGDDNRIVNYYSHHDPFRWVPPFSRYIGQQKNVLLQPFQSRSNIIASVLERIYWAHIPKYYAFDKKGRIKLNKQPSQLENWYHYLNQRTRTTWWINILIVLAGLIPSLILLSIITLFVGISQEYVGHSFYNIGLATITGTLVGLFASLSTALVSLIFSIFYMLPTLITKSRWKYIILGLNVFLSWTGVAWLALLLLAIVLNYASDKDYKA